jgi:hypothetical protein
MQMKFEEELISFGIVPNRIDHQKAIFNDSVSFGFETHTLKDMAAHFTDMSYLSYEMVLLEDGIRFNFHNFHNPHFSQF